MEVISPPKDLNIGQSSCKFSAYINIDKPLHTYASVYLSIHLSAYIYNGVRHSQNI